MMEEAIMVLYAVVTVIVAAATIFTGGHGNVQSAYIRGKHGGMKLVSMGDGLENVSSKIWEEKVWKH